MPVCRQLFTGDVQIGWCVKCNSGRYIEDMDGRSLAGPFRTLDAATSAADQVLAQFADERNPGW